MREVKAYGAIKEGRLHVRNRPRFDECMRLFPECEVTITVRKLYPKRSTKVTHEDGRITFGQNGYYRGVICQAVVDGAWEQNREIYTNEMAHQELKANCNYDEVINDATGEVRRRVRSTADLDTLQFEDYLERCRLWIREWFGIDCPPPNEQAELIFKN